MSLDRKSRETHARVFIRKMAPAREAVVDAQSGVQRGLIRACLHATVRSGEGCACPAGGLPPPEQGRCASGVEIERGPWPVAIRDSPKITYLSGNLPIEAIPGG